MVWIRATSVRPAGLDYSNWLPDADHVQYVHPVQADISVDVVG